MSNASFESVVMPHADAAYNLARWLTGTVADAEDLTQEALCRALRFIDQFRGGDARAWVLKIVRNLHNEWHRARARGAAVEFDEDLHTAAAAVLAPPLPGPEEAAAGAQEAKRIDRALRQLKPKFREALVLHEVADLSYQQITALLGIPMGTVMSRIARARGQLRKEIRGSL